MKSFCLSEIVLQSDFEKLASDSIFLQQFKKIFSSSDFITSDVSIEALIEAQKRATANVFPVLKIDFEEETLVAALVARVLFERAELDYIVVSSSVKRRSYGKSIYQRFENFCLQKGVSTIALEVSVKNSVAKSFYHSLGFFQTGVRNKYYKDGSDAVLMEKKLCV